MDRRRARTANDEWGQRLPKVTHDRAGRRALPADVAYGLKRLARAARFLAQFAAVFGRPVTQHRDESARMIEAGDRKTLFDVVEAAVNEFVEIKTRIETAMNDTPATGAEPGSAEKIEILRQRAAGQRSLFIAGDLERR